MAIGDPSTQGEPLVIKSTGSFPLFWGSPDVIIVDLASGSRGTCTINLPTVTTDNHGGFGQVKLFVRNDRGRDVRVGPSGAVEYGEYSWVLNKGSNLQASGTNVRYRIIRRNTQFMPVHQGESFIYHWVGGDIQKWYAVGVARR